MNSTNWRIKNSIDTEVDLAGKCSIKAQLKWRRIKWNRLEEGLGKNMVSYWNHNLTEPFIHQLIETIEFVLSTNSNNSSYLRLYALSVAHWQLAAMFFENTIEVLIEKKTFLYAHDCSKNILLIKIVLHII